MVNPYVISVIQYYISYNRPILQIHSMEIAQMVSADHTIFPIIGWYHIYMMDVVTQMVPAGPIIFPHDRLVPDIHNVCDRTNGTSQPYHIFHNRLVPDIHDGCERTNGTGRLYHIPHDRLVPDIHNVY